MPSIRTFSTLACAALLLSACGAIDSMKEGFAHTTAVQAELEKTLEMKSFVGFNWNNGSLTAVSVTFEGLPKKHTLEEVTAESKRAILAEFKQKPEQIVISFALKQ